MNWQRIFHHIRHSRLATRQAFPADALARIEAAIRASEQKHRGEIRFVVEGEWPWSALWQDISVREQAIDLFGRLRVWDTEENTGILVYVLLAERRMEIVADRGISALVAPGEWETICRQTTERFANGAFEEGALAAIEATSGLLQRHFPARAHNPNELPDTPLVL